MDFSGIMNLILGGGLVATVIKLLTLRSAVREANAAAERALAEAESVRITNTESATRVLIENIVEPLKEELNETRKRIRRLEEAVALADRCRHYAVCPVIYGLRHNTTVDVGKCRERDEPDVDRGRHRNKGDPEGGDTDEPGVCDGERGQPP